MRNDFAVLILSHGRADKVHTMDTLFRCKYTGRWYIIIDNEDDQANIYYEKYGKDHVIMFDKPKKSLTVDTMNVPGKRNAVVFAREMCFEIAKSLGLSYFLELDDDYTNFRCRFDKGGSLSSVYVTDVEPIFNEMLSFLTCSPNITCVAMSQTGDFMGGVDSTMFKARLYRKAMNTFFCNVNKPFHFLGMINEDVNMYVSEGARGKLFLTVADVNVDQPATQEVSGGLTDIYKEKGTYVKSFYSVMTEPSSVKVSQIGQGHIRIHHTIDWNTAVPKVISGRFKKEQ